MEYGSLSSWCDGDGRQLWEVGCLSDLKHGEPIVEPLESVRAPTQPELKIAEHVAAYNAGDTSKVAHIDECEEERRKREGVSSQCPQVSCRCIKCIVLEEQ